MLPSSVSLATTLVSGRTQRKDELVNAVVLNFNNAGQPFAARDLLFSRGYFGMTFDEKSERVIYAYPSECVQLQLFDVPMDIDRHRGGDVVLGKVFVGRNIAPTAVDFTAEECTRLYLQHLRITREEFFHEVSRQCPVDEYLDEDDDNPGGHRAPVGTPQLNHFVAGKRAALASALRQLASQVQAILPEGARI
jgi:hypothetical protein